MHDLNDNALTQSSCNITSSDTSICTVSVDGAITAVSTGEVTITVTYHGIVGSVTITIVPDTLEVKVYASDAYGGAEGESLTEISKVLSDDTYGYYQVYPYEMDGTSISRIDCNITSSDTSICTVNQYGIITAVSGGTVTIIVTHGDNVGTVTFTIIP